MLGTVLRCWALLGAVSAVHVAFIAPPASHYAPMLPIAHGLLDDGHQVRSNKPNDVIPPPVFLVLGCRSPWKTDAFCDELVFHLRVGSIKLLGLKCWMSTDEGCLAGAQGLC